MGEGAELRAALDVRDVLDTIWLAAWLTARPEAEPPAVGG